MNEHVWIPTLTLTVGLFAARSLPAQSESVNTSIRAVGYQLGTTSKVDLRPSELMPQARGEAEVVAKKGLTNIEISVSGLSAPTKLGTEFLTYVVWVVSPGREWIHSSSVPHNARSSTACCRVPF